MMTLSLSGGYTAQYRADCYPRGWLAVYRVERDLAFADSALTVSNARHSFVTVSDGRVAAGIDDLKTTFVL